ncbi:22566_t:CDS:2 [Entrophospora sp. SA101]|nr:22566_t:CDS:2 [Entrophospora sp. SA101]
MDEELAKKDIFGEFDEKEEQAKAILKEISKFLTNKKNKKRLNKAAAEMGIDADGKITNVGNAKVELSKITAERRAKLRGLSKDGTIQNLLDGQELFENKFTALSATGSGSKGISETSEYFNLAYADGIDVLSDTTSIGKQAGGNEQYFFATLFDCNIVTITNSHVDGGVISVSIVEPNGEASEKDGKFKDNKKETIWLFHSGDYDLKKGTRLKVELAELEAGSSQEADAPVELENKTGYHARIGDADFAELEAI